MECILNFARVPSLSGRSYQRLLVAQPVKLGGLGIRSLVETRHPAFLGGLEQALPFMVAGELCELPLAPSLQAMIGDMAGQGRWAGLLAAGSRTALEFQVAWADLAGEARCIWDYLGEEPTGSLADPVDGVGGSSVDGGTRTRAVQQRESLRHQLLERALAAHPDRDARPVTVYQNVSDESVPAPGFLQFRAETTASHLLFSRKLFLLTFAFHLRLSDKEVGWESLSALRGR